MQQMQETGFNFWVRKVLGGGNVNPLQYSCLGNLMDRGAWQATVHGVAKSWIGLSMHAHRHTYEYIYVSNLSCIYIHTHIYVIFASAYIAMGFSLKLYYSGFLI